MLEPQGKPFDNAELKARLDALIGISYFSKLNEIKESQLMEQADQAMYKVKRAGGNGYSVFAEDKKFKE